MLHNCENITQAACRDLMAQALLRLDRAGFPIVLHVHDEIIVELDDASRLEEFAELMCEPPDWAAGFPIGVGAHAARRYSKDAPKGAPEANVERELAA